MRVLFLTFAFMLAASCTYHNVEEQFGENLPDCDTLAVSYTKQLVPLLQANCVSCHNSGNPSGGMVLSSYEDLKIAANSGRLLGAIKHETGFSPMPQGASPLSDCDIAQIEAWISQGLNNN